MANWKRIVSMLVAVFMLLTMPIMTGISRTIAEDTAPQNGTLTITKKNVGGDQDDEFNFVLDLTIDPATTSITIDTLTDWIDNFLKDGGQLFSDEEKQAILQKITNYLLGHSAGELLELQMHFTLKGGEKATIEELDGGVAYKIKEEGTEGYTPAANGQTGELGGSLTVTGVIDGNKTIAFKNTFGKIHENGTLTITKKNIGGDPEDEFNYTMKLTIDPSVMDLSISTVTSWIDKFLKDGGQLFTEEEANNVLQQLIDYLLGNTGSAGDPIVINANFTLKDGDVATIQNLEGGIAYEITEEGTEGYTPSANGQTGELGGDLKVSGVVDGNKTIVFKNTFGEIADNGTLTITKKNIGGDPEDEFNYTMKLTIDPSAMELSISTVTSWIDKFLKDGGQLFTEEEANNVLQQLIDYLLGNTGSAGDPIVINANFTLKDGDVATIQNLEGGIVYEITEEGTEGYTPSANGQTAAIGEDLTVTGVIDGNKTIAFKNTFGTIPENGTLTISKTNDGGDPDDEFNYNMKLTIDPSAMELSISTVTSWIDKFLKDGGQLFTEEEANNVLQQLIDYLLGNTGSAGDPIVINAHFTLKDGDVATIQNLEGGITYEITEEGTEGYTPSANGQTAAIGEDLTVSGVIDGNKTIAFKNTFGTIPENGTLTISKTNAGGNQDDVFNYNMNLTIDPSVMDLSISTVTSWIDKFLRDGGQLFTDEEKTRVLQQLIDYLLGNTGSAGDPIVINAQFTLKGGETATIQNLEGGIVYEITEEGTEGYTPAANGQTGELGGELTVTGVVDGNKTIVFKNTFGTIPENGTLTISKTNVDGNPDDEFNFAMKLTIDPSSMELSISTVTSWIDKFLKDGGQLFTEEEANNVLQQLIDYLLGNTGSAGDPIVINAQFTLKGGETATIQNLEGGIAYEITEEGTANYTPSANGETGTLGGELTVSGVIDGDAAVAFTNTYTQPADPKFKTHSIVMSGSIGVNFFMDLNTLSDEEKEAGYMTFEISGKGTITDRDDFDPNFKNTTNKYYGFTCFINSIQMADTITATYHYCDGQTKSETYSIKKYLTAIDQNVSSFEADMVSLLHALGDFGHYVQPFLAEEKGWTIGEDYAEMDKYYTETYDLDAVREAVAAKEAVRGTNDDIEAVNFTLVLDSETAIKVFFKLADEYTGTFKATLGSGTENVAQLQEDGRYMVLIPKIRAQQLGNTYTIKATTESGTAVSKISGLSYAQAILNSPAFADNTNALNAMAALYFYYLRAHEYTTAHAN